MKRIRGLGVPRVEDKVGIVERLRDLKGSYVEVHLIDGKVLKGTLSSVDPDFLNVLLEDVEVGDGRRVPIALVSGGYIAAVLFLGLKPLEDLDLKVLSILQRNPGLSAADVARMINEEPSKVRSAIRRLRRSGLIPPSTRPSADEREG
ncbi:hypothetical protein B6U99_05820 [Candidatus Geothermarchaeota archaeon ex4572_27]|nr:MAG: hypothetical protein B6U99_05820 [Candidatus Geothermarchaeota archaeon ex4572_27]